MATLSDLDALLKKGKRKSASSVQLECSLSGAQPEDHKHLNQLLDHLLDPRKPISDIDSIEWLRWLLAGGKTPDEFKVDVKHYDKATTCGLVWTANFVAYRCRTCGISPCMSLCADCFKKGNHEGHDFNMFRSQAGGACDCGDASVMKETGFCVRHGPNVGVDKPSAPPDLLCVAKAMMPRLLHRVVVQLRRSSSEALKEADPFVTEVLTYMTDMGAAMRTVMSDALINPTVYSSLVNSCDSRELEISNLLFERYQNYLKAKKDMANFRPPLSFHRDCSVCCKETCVIKAFEKDLTHTSFAEELLFWTIIYEFPQKLVCFLLNMLPDTDYKEAFAKSFVHHYSRISMMLARFRNGDDNGSHHLTSKPSPHDLLSNCVVHVSVQLFSNEPLAAKLCQHQHLLHVMIASLRATIEGVVEGPEDVNGILIKSNLQNGLKNRHMVVRCDHYIMRKHSYWPLVSDLNNILTHSPVAIMFMSDCTLLELWLEFIMDFQGMNLNVRELEEHVEYENDAYYAAFSAELEICATPIWTLISHLKDAATAHLTRQVVKHTQHSLEKWFDLIAFTSYDVPNAYQATFHIPLHRYFSIFLCHGIKHQGLCLSELLPPSEATLKLYLAHPLQVLISFYEILCGLWVRNGLQMKGQAMTFIQCHFCNSMVDPDLFLIQQCASKLKPDWFIQTVMERFHVWDWLSFAFTKEKPYRGGFLETDQVMPMLEGALTLLATLFTVRTNLGMSEEAITRQEMVTLLAMSDRTHSQLMDLLPEKCGTTTQAKDFESILGKVAQFKGPTLESGGNLSQGMFCPKPEVWENEYDPLHVLLRAVHRRDYQSSMDRFTTYAKQSSRLKSNTSLPWPPFRLPLDPDTNKYLDPRKLLYSKVLHGVLFSILYKALYVCDVSDQVLALTVYLLEMSLCFPSPEDTSPAPQMEEVTKSPLCVVDQKYQDWFGSDWVLLNFDSLVQLVSVNEKYAEGDISLIASQDDEPAVEEMEVDLHSSSDETGNDDTFMSADEGFDNEEGSGSERSIEGGPHVQRLTGANIALALPPASGGSSDQTSTGGASSALVPVPRPYLDTLAAASSPPTLSNAASTPLPGPSTSPNTSTAVVLRSALTTVMRPQRRPRGSRRSRITPNQRSIDYTADGSQQDYKRDPQMAVSELMRALPTSNNGVVTVTVNESILSLLIKLHSKLSNEPDTFRPSPVPDDKRIGDGPYFIGRVIDIYSKMNVTNGMKRVEDWRLKIWPPKVPSSPSFSGGTASGNESDGGKGSDHNRDERRRKAKERQQKLMAEFASRQKAFMKKMNETMGSESPENMEETLPQSAASGFFLAKEFECVICGQTCPSTLDRLMGMVVLLQPTSVLGHSRIKQSPVVSEKDDEDRHTLPCTDEDIGRHQNKVNLANYMEQKIDEFSRSFDPSSWLNALNIGWEGGVHVQSCGHYLHLDCQKSYIQSLRTTQTGNRQGLEHGEYACPLCRQMANSVLPVNPDNGLHGAIVRSRPNDVGSVSQEVMNMLANIQPPDANFIKLLGGFMEDLTKATLPQYRNCLRTSPTTHSLFLFLCSIARTNLECDVLAKSSGSAPTGAKRSCFVSLFHVLALNGKVFLQQAYVPLWSQLTGLALPDDQAMSLIQLEKEVPLILRDPAAILIQFFFALPLNVEKAFFSSVTQMLYNLNLVQALAQLSCLITEEERERYKSQAINSIADMTKISSFIGLLVNILEHSSLYMHLDEEDGAMPNRSWSPIELHEASRSLCLPFLRTACMFQTHLYKDSYPDIDDKVNEFELLADCLGLQINSDLGYENDSSVLTYLNWSSDDPLKLIRTWSQEFINLVEKSLISSRKLLRNKPVSLERPSLLRLPQTYDQLFLYYHQRSCKTCNKVPKEPCVCLVCGSLVCMRESCCRSANGLEAVTHSEVCGAGTTIYLAVNSSTIIVIRGKRACVWGSVYLDTYGEEDRDLKRGKPLYLSEQRYWVLEQQWLTHSFDHTSKRWVWHKDTL